MLYYLKYPSHDVEKLHELLIYFFDKIKSISPTSFDHTLLFPAWYNTIPIHRMTKLENLLAEFIGFSPTIKNEIIDAFQSSNDIPSLFSNLSADISTAKDFDKYLWKMNGKIQLTIKDFLSDMFIYLYNIQLGSKKSSFCKSIGTDLAKQYDDFLTLNTENFTSIIVCPICGLEKMRDEDNIRKPDHDHLLPKGDDFFVFSAVNTKNLFPMGSDCNIKKDSSMLLYREKDLITRTIAFYPYDSPPHPFEQYSINLTCKELPNYTNLYKGKWIVDIEPKDVTDKVTKDKIETWDRVFGIKERIVKVISDSNKAIMDLEIEITRINKNDELDEKLDELIRKHPMEYMYLSTIIDHVPKKIFFEWAKREPTYLRNHIPSNLGLNGAASVDLAF